MEKKFIAIIVAFVILVTAVAVGVAISINKKDTYVDPDGVEHWLVKDDEGNTMVNGDGDVVVYATDEKGKRQKDENGEYITAVIDFPEIVVDGNTLETPDFRLTMPKGWDLSDDGVFELKKNDKITVKVNVFDLENPMQVDDYIKQAEKDSKEFLDALKGVFPAFEMEEKSAVITMKNLDCRIFEAKMGKEKGDVEFYSIGVNFTRGAEAYQIALTCEGGSYEDLDKDLDLVSILDANFVVKDYADK